MNEDVLSVLIHRFHGLTQNIAQVRPETLEQYLKEFPSQYRLRDVIAPASLLFHRQWIRTSIRGHKKKVRLALRALKRNDESRARHELAMAYLWIGQAQKLFETVTFFSHFAIKDLDHYRLSANDLQSGDIILSYKTQSYIKHSRVSWLVKMACNSSITHALLVYVDKDAGPLCLFSGDTVHGLGIMPITPEPSELFIIMRLKDTSNSALLKKRVEDWYTKSQKRMALPPKEQRLYFPFSEIKCQIASMVGLITVCFIYLGIPITLKNPFKKTCGLFCSEFVDVVFKEAGYVLGPRAEHDAIIGPTEFLYSSFLELKGVIAHPEDLLSVQDEIHEQFIGYPKQRE